MPDLRTWAASAGRELQSALVRRKTLDKSDMTRTKLARCLSLLDLTAIGVGCTLGAGIYVVAGSVARNTAGPGVVLSFLVAGLASVLAGLCYAEFGARVPKTGSAYVYSYVAVGEFAAFVIGWNMMLEYVIGTASVARALSGYIDSIASGAITTFYKAHMTITFSQDFQITIDMLAFAFVMLLTVVLCIGVRESSAFNNVFTAVNLFVVAYVTICGFFKYNFSYWAIDANDVPQIANGTKCDTINKGTNTSCFGNGGFLPYGLEGMLSGAATCFYAFVGFDVIATAGEAVHNPQRNLPLSIVLCLLACSLAYLGVSATITLICPYYSLDAQTPLTTAFTYVGWPVATYIISAGAVCALSASMLAGLLPLPRVIFAMAEDGIVFRWLASVHPKTHTPIIATAISGLLSAAMAALFDLQALVEMMSIGTLLAYAIVALSVTLLRYRPPLFAVDLRPRNFGALDEHDVNPATLEAHSSIDNLEVKVVHDEIVPSVLDFQAWRSLLIERACPEPDSKSSYFTAWLIGLFSLLTVVTCLLFALLDLTTPIGIVICSVFFVLCSLVTLLIARMPESKEEVYFKVPLVPFLPCFSMFVNLYLMSKLSYATWIRFAVWMFFGLVIYFGYGVWHSSEKTKSRVDTSESERAPLNPQS